MSFNYDGPPFSVSDLVDRACLLYQSGESPTRRIKRLEKERIIRNARKATVIKKIGLYKDKKVAYTFRLAERLMYLKDYRKDVLFHSYFMMDRLIREIGRRYELSATQVKHILPGEMRHFLEGRLKLTSNILNERIRCSVLFFSCGTMCLEVGRRAHALVKKYAETPPVDTCARQLNGECAYPGKARGIVRIICSTSDMSKMRQGDILVSVSTNPNLLPAIRKAAGIITDRGGITCHAAIIARELGIPCIIGTGVATRVLTDGECVSLDASIGRVERSL